MLFKIKLLEVINQRKQQRTELTKQALQLMCEYPDVRDIMIEKLKHLQQEEEEETKMMALELQKNPLPAIENSSQPVNLQVTY